MNRLAHDVWHAFLAVFRMRAQPDGSLPDRLLRLEYGFVSFCAARIWFGASHGGSIAAAECGLAVYMVAGYVFGPRRHRPAPPSSGS
jgi:hypothetical protein